MFYYEFYQDQESLLERIEELKEIDFYEEDFHLSSLDESDELKWLKYTSINFHPYERDDSDGGFRGIISNKEPANRYLHKVGLDEDTVEEYFNRLSNGEYLLSYSDHYKRRRSNERLGQETSSDPDLEIGEGNGEYDYPK